MGRPCEIAVAEKNRVELWEAFLVDRLQHALCERPRLLIEITAHFLHCIVHLDCVTCKLVTEHKQVSCNLQSRLGLGHLLGTRLSAVCVTYLDEFLLDSLADSLALLGEGMRA